MSAFIIAHSNQLVASSSIRRSLCRPPSEKWYAMALTTAIISLMYCYAGRV